MEVLFDDRQILCPTEPKVKKRSDDVKRISDAHDSFIHCEANLFAQRIVRLKEPAVIVCLALTAKASEL